MTDTVELWSSDEAIERVGEGLTYVTLHRWVNHGAVTPSQPPTGPGSRTGWSAADISAIEAIARVRADLATLGMPCPWRLVAELWSQLRDTGREAGLHARTVTISCLARPVRSGSED